MSKLLVLPSLLTYGLQSIVGVTGTERGGD